MSLKSPESFTFFSAKTCLTIFIILLFTETVIIVCILRWIICLLNIIIKISNRWIWGFNYFITYVNWFSYGMLVFCNSFLHCQRCFDETLKPFVRKFRFNSIRTSTFISTFISSMRQINIDLIAAIFKYIQKIYDFYWQYMLLSKLILTVFIEALWTRVYSTTLVSILNNDNGNNNNNSNSNSNDNNYNNNNNNNNDNNNNNNNNWRKILKGGSDWWT